MGDFFFGAAPQKAQLEQAATGQQANQSFQNTQQGLDQQQAFLQALQGQGGVQNQSDVYNQLAMQAAGQGPNPAQAALQNATGQNIAAQNALMAGQRGAGANPALMARQAAMQGANINQQAAGQGALMQAQQQQAAMGQMGNIAGQQVQNLGQAGQAYSQAAGQQQGNVYGAIGQQNQANLANQDMYNKGQAGRGLGGVINQLGGVAAKIATGGMLNSGGPAVPQQAPQQAPSGFGLGVNTNLGGPTNFGIYNQGGQVGPQSAFVQALAMKQGGKVPGKAKVEGDSVENDVVHVVLSPGEFVIPRTVMQEKDPAKAAASFIRSHLVRKSAKRKRK